MKTRMRTVLYGALALFPAMTAGPLAALAAYTGAPGSSSAPSAAPALPAVAPAPAGVPQAAPPGGSGGSLLSGLPEVNVSWSGYFEALAILCFVLALLWAALWLIKRGTGGKGLFASSAPSLQIESRLALGPKKWIYITRCLDRRLVLGVTDDRITLLTELFPEEVPRPAPAAKKDTSPPAPESGNAFVPEAAGRGFPFAAGEARPATPAESDADFSSLLNNAKDPS